MEKKIFVFRGEDAMYVATVILLILTLLPISMCIPNQMRMIIQIFSMIIFFLGILLYKNKKMVLLFCVIVAIVLFRVYGTWKMKKSFSSCFFSVYASWTFAFYGFVCSKMKDYTHIKKILNIVFWIMLVTTITTIIGITKNPLVVRELGRSGASYTGITGAAFDQLKYSYRLENIAGWNQLYGMVFLIPIFLVLYQRNKEKKYLVISILMLICIICSQITFALLISIALFIISFISQRKTKKSIIIEIIVLIIVFICMLMYKEILLLAISFFENNSMNMLSNKLNDLYMLLNGINTGDSLSRTSLYNMSIEIFRRHPLLGQSFIGISEGISFSNHSDFFDMLAFYGLFGIVVLIFGCVLYLNHIIKMKTENKNIIIVLFVAFLGLYIVNPVWYSPQIFVGVFLLPTIFSYQDNLINHK